MENKGLAVSQHIEEMQSAANALAEYSFPQVSTEDDHCVSILKNRQIFIDGYDIKLMFSRADYSQFPGFCSYIETLEIASYNGTYLPMHLVCKIATRFLGGHELLHYSKYHKGHKVYVWKVCLDSQGKPVVADKARFEFRKFEDIEYSLIA